VSDEPLTEALVVQIREVPGHRAVRMRYEGARSGLEEAVATLTRTAIAGGVGPCGPAVADYLELAPEGEDPAISVDILVPVRGTPQEDDFPVVEIGPMRVAFIHYNGPLETAFRRAHLSLFSWMDAHAHPRAGTRHLHAYLAGQGSSGDWSVELRVPLIGGGAPRPPV